MADHNFEQDRSYTDMETGQTKMFTIRDYSKKTKVAMTNTTTDESRTAAQKAYDDACWDVVDEIIARNPAPFARESYKAVEVNGGIIEWNREGLFWMYRDSESQILGSDWNNLKKELTRSILDYLGYPSNELPVNFRELIEGFRDNFEETQTL